MFYRLLVLLRKRSCNIGGMFLSYARLPLMFFVLIYFLERCQNSPVRKVNIDGILFGLRATDYISESENKRICVKVLHDV